MCATQRVWLAYALSLGVSVNVFRVGDTVISEATVKWNSSCLVVFGACHVILTKREGASRHNPHPSRCSARREEVPQPSPPPTK